MLRAYCSVCLVIAALLSPTFALSADLATLEKIVAIQQAENAALKSERDKLKKDMTVLWKKMDQLTARVNKLMEKNQLSESDLTQPVNTIVFCQSCVRTP